MMKNRMNKILAASLMVGLLATGCGNNGPTGAAITLDNTPDGILVGFEIPEIEVKEEAKTEETEVKEEAKAKEEVKAEETVAKTETAVTPKAETPKANNTNTQAATKPATQTTTPKTEAPAPKAETPAPKVETPTPQPVHEHVWKDHIATKTEWVSNMVEVPDYETRKEFYWDCNCGAFIPDAEQEEHCMNHALNGEPANGRGSLVETTVQVGSHMEDHGYNQTVEYVDYQYCDCGATR